MRGLACGWVDVRMGRWMGGWLWHETNLPSRVGQALFGRDTCIGQSTQVDGWVDGQMGG